MCYQLPATWSEELKHILSSLNPVEFAIPQSLPRGYLHTKSTVLEDSLRYTLLVYTGG